MKRFGKVSAFFLLFALVHPYVAPLASAQKQTFAPPPVGKPALTLETEHEGFIIYQSNGEVACRDATDDEARRIDRRDPDVKLIILRNKSNEAELSESEQYSANAESTGLKIILRGTTRLDQQYPNVKAAFIRAAAVWESLIKSDITVVIDVDYGPDRFGEAWEGNVLGSTSSAVLTPSPQYDDVRQRLQTRSPGAEELMLYNALRAGSLPTSQGAATRMRVVTPIARALGIMSPHADPSNPREEISIGFNSNFSFDLDPDDGIAAGLTDFDAVAVHEMGHALGFSSGVRDASATSIQPSVWDIFRFRPGTAMLATFGTAERVLTTGATGDQHICFNGGPELQLSTGNEKGDGGDGEQASHWKDDRFGGPYIGIMDPTIRAGRRFQITDNDRKAIDTFGYVVAGAVPPPPPAPANDNFANATQISGISGTLTATNVSATKEAGEPSNIPDTSGGRSVWYRWQAPASGTAVIDTLGSGFDTTLAVYRGSTLTALSLVPNGANDDIVLGEELQSRVTISVAAGEIYHIVVDGFDGDFGNITLHWLISNPIDTLSFFVRQQYLDFLAREPEQGGFDGWMAKLAQCPASELDNRFYAQDCTRIDVSAAFFRSQEFQLKGYYLLRFYQVALGRLPKYVEFDPDMKLVTGQTDQEFLQKRDAFPGIFVARPEFRNKYDALSNAAFVDELLRTGGVAQALAGRRDAWVSELQAGAKTRAQVLREVVESAEVYQKYYNEAFVAMEYFGYLRRDPDPAGFGGWLDHLNRTNNYREMVWGFLYSPEYKLRFGPVPGF